ARVEVERLEVVNLPGEVVAGLVTRAVDPAGPEEQRAQLVASDSVEEPAAHFRLEPLRLAIDVYRLNVASTPLVIDGRIESPGAHAPARIGTERVAVLMERGRAVRVGRGAECGRAGRGPAYDVNVGRTTPSIAARSSFGVEERVERLDVEPFEDRVLRADDAREVVATSILECLCGRAVRTRRATSVSACDFVLDHDIGEVGLEVRRKRRERGHPREVAVRV